MSETTVTSVLHYYRYLSPEGTSVYETVYFCGECLRHLGTPYEFAKYPDALEADWWDTHGELTHFAFCPWCGSAFEDEWWKDDVIQNERVIDHFQDPGTHKGDMHEFRGSDPNCMANHWLGTTGPDICWCEPEVEPGIMGCVIRHQDKSYEEYVASLPAPSSDCDAWCDSSDGEA